MIVRKVHKTAICKAPSWLTKSYIIFSRYLINTSILQNCLLMRFYCFSVSGPFNGLTWLNGQLFTILLDMFLPLGIVRGVVLAVVHCAKWWSGVKIAPDWLFIWMIIISRLIFLWVSILTFNFLIEVRSTYAAVFIGQGMCFSCIKWFA